MLVGTGIPLYPPTLVYQQLIAEEKSRVNACRGWWVAKHEWVPELAAEGTNLTYRSWWVCEIGCPADETCTARSQSSTHCCSDPHLSASCASGCCSAVCNHTKLRCFKRPIAARLQSHLVLSMRLLRALVCCATHTQPQHVLIFTVAA